MMNSFDPQRWQQDHRRQKNIIGASSSTSSSSLANFYASNNKKTKYNKLQTLSHGLELDDDLVSSSVVPAVTVVLEGRSICQRISLHNHGSYQSLAKALRQMFVDCTDDFDAGDHHLDLSNAIPGHVIAYEDMENDLLLAGDLTWK